MDFLKQPIIFIFVFVLFIILVKLVFRWISNRMKDPYSKNIPTKYTEKPKKDNEDMVGLP